MKQLAGAFVMSAQRWVFSDTDPNIVTITEFYLTEFLEMW